MIKIKELLETLPMGFSNNPEYFDVLSKIQDMLKDIRNVRVFVHYCNDSSLINEWLYWLEKNEYINVLFVCDTNIEQDTREKILCYTVWFVNNFVIKNHAQGMLFLKKKGYRLSNILWSEIARKIWIEYKNINQSVLGQWVLILLKSYQDGCMVDFLAYLLKELEYPKNDKISVLLIDFLTKPNLIVKKNFISEEKELANEKTVYFDIEIKGEMHWLKEFWKRRQDSGMGDSVFDFLSICEKHIIDADRMMRIVKETSEKYYDHINAGRSAIEKHEQDEYNDDFYFNVDVLRDCIVNLQEYKPKISEAIIETWICSDVLLLTRMAIYAIGKNKTLSNNEKLLLIINNRWLLFRKYKHEVFQLLSVAYHGTDDKIKHRLLDDYYDSIKNNKDTEESESDVDRAIYDLTGFLLGYGDCRILKDRFDQIQKKYSIWQLSEYPDLNSYMISRSGESDSIEMAEKLENKTLEEIVDFALKNKNHEDVFDPGRYDIQVSLKHYSKNNVEKSIDVIKELINREEDKSDYIRYIIYGWQDAEFTDELWERIVTFIENTPQIDFFANAILDVFNKKKIPDDSIPRFTVLIYRIWRQFSKMDKDVIEEKDDWLNASINHPGGKAAESWISYLSKMQEKEGKEWERIPEPYLTYFSKIIHEDHQTAEMGRIFIASQLHLFFYWDEEWTQKNLFPEFDFTNNGKRARQAWHGYLAWGKTNRQLLDKFFIFYKKSFSSISTDSERMRDRWCEHLAYIALVMEKNPFTEWIIDFIKAIEEEDFHKWLYHIGFIMGRWENASDVENVWNEWLRDYWKARNENNPIPMSDKERAYMLNWCIPLEPVFKEVVKLIFDKQPAPDFGERTSFFHFYTESEISKKYPNESAELLRYILKDQKRLLWQDNYLKKWLEDLISMKVGSKILEEIFDYLELLGYFELLELRKNIQ